MNERIEQLVAQATTEESDGFKYFDKEKFARLIVRECADIAADAEQSKGGMPAKYHVLDYFGVEE